MKDAPLTFFCYNAGRRLSCRLFWGRLIGTTMDKEREIRLLIPPIFFFASLFLGIVVNPDKSIAEVTHNFFDSANNIWPNNDVAGILQVLAGGGLLLFTAGYSIGGITILLLRFLFWAYNSFISNGKYKGTYEAAMPKDDVQSLMKLVSAEKGNNDFTDNEVFFAGVTFDHEITPKRSKPLHKWMVRRWTAFNISSSSSVALILSLIFGWWYNLFTCGWYIWMLMLSVMFCLSAIHAWHGCMGMLKFQAERTNFNKPPRE